MPQYCFYDNVEKYNVNFIFENMQDDLLDTERIVSRMIQFYFPKLSDEEVQKYRKNLKLLVQLIDESEYSDYVKEKLCVFFVNYEWIIKKLNFELISKEAQLKFYYERNYKKIADFESNLDFDDLVVKLPKVYGKNFVINEKKDIYISPCIVYKNCAITCFLNDSNFILLGLDIESMLNFWHDQTRLVDLDVFGTAVSEKNRIGIIDALLLRDEMSIREIEQMFGISNTNAYYHLNLMLKANIIHVRNQGRTMFYSLNREYFDNLIEALKKYGTKKGREEI
ncbi:ArsR/SmtB family transcription factor [Fumia xinanensis]|uniref:Winged helix-turn-helix transcriptional regulator n=1 Tax=Fumia xinanensis TaxID=2763659 RepID=A0A926E5N0_9FIRM|nr:winged helix-turn-helix domain-containing protein [Fumia xinanensis]MBC8560153.1 winged helix-turn-helix transcriptional regulator [Fumia xinanensis]